MAGASGATEGAEPAFVLRYGLGRDDLVAAAERFPDRTNRHGRLHLALLLGPGFAWGLAATSIFPGLSRFALYSLAPVALLIGLGLVVLSMRRDHVRRLAGLPDGVRETVLTIFDDHLVLSGAGADQFQFLTSAKPAVGTPGHVFLEFSDRTVVIIPARAFADAHERQALEAHLAWARTQDDD